MIRTLAIMLLLGVFLDSCDSGCNLESLNRRPLEIAHRMHGVNPNVTGPISSMPHLLFTGNVTTLVPGLGNPAQNVNGVGLMRQPDCSLTEYFLGSYNMTASTFAVAGTTASYQNTLHSLAGLKTTANQFLHGCTEPTLGIASHTVVYLGATSSGSLIAAGIDYQNTLRAGTMNLSAGSFNQSALSVPGPSGLATTDLNGDGKADLVVAANGTGSSFQGAGVYVLLGNGDGTFAAAVKYMAMSVPSGVTIDDVNGDGKFDLVVVGTDNNSGGTGGIQVLLGKGDGTFNAAVASGGVKSSYQAATGDFNGDHKKDLVASGQILLGNGDGTFAAPVFTLPAGSGGLTPATGDFNNDGKLDIAIDAGNDNLVSIFLGNGDGTFNTGTSYAAVYGSASLSATDLDGDGNLDLVVGIGNSGLYGPDQNSGGSIEILMGNGDGTFQSAPAYPNSALSISPGVSTFASGDFNGDGKLDLMGVAVNGGVQGLVFLAGDGSGHFAAAKVSPEQQPSVVASGDLNGDGKLDAIYADLNAGNVAVALGKGDGTFATGVDYTLPLGTAIQAIAVADVNGDGKPDVIVSAVIQGTNPSGSLYVYVNKGDGTLPASPAIVDVPATPGALAVGDLNGDGKPDIVLTNSAFLSTTAGSLLVYLGKGDGSFKTAVSYPAGYSSTGLAISDVNKDGKADLVFGSNDSAYTTATLDVLPGNGDGTFGTAVSSPLQYTGTTNLAVADFDGDGNPDVLVGQCCGLAFTSVSFGKGDGTFPNNYGIAPGPSSSFVLAADVNGDKHPDILATTGNAIEVFVNLYGSVVTPTLTPTTTTLTAKPNLATAGAAVLLNAKVVENPGTAVPAGTVTFLDGTATLGTATLDGTGAATFSTSSLAAGAHGITASYGGDTSNAASVSTAVTVTVQASAPSFGLSLSPGSATMSGGGSTTTVVTVTPVNGFHQAVSFACSGLPVNSTCSFSPATVTPSGATATTTLTIQTGVKSALLPVAGGSVLALALGCFLPRLRRRKQLWLWVVLATTFGVAVGCGGNGTVNKGNNTPAGTSQVTITATAGSLTQSATFALTVN